MSHSSSLNGSHLGKTGSCTLVPLTLQEQPQDLCLRDGDLSALVKHVKHNSNAEDYYYPLREKRPQSSDLIQEILS